MYEKTEYIYSDSGLDELCETNGYEFKENGEFYKDEEVMITYLGELTTFSFMVADLRERGADETDDVSDAFLIAESYQAGEWE